MALNPEPYKSVFNIPYLALPEAREWKTGNTYEVTAKIKQVTQNADDAVFEIVEIKSVSPRPERKYLSSEEGILQVS